MERLHHIALLPPPVFLGHLIPFIELAKKLVSDYNFTITLLIPDDGSSMQPQKALLEGLPLSINHIFLLPITTDTLPDNADAEMLLSIRIIRSLPALRETIASLKDSGPPVEALVMDLFAPYAIDVAKEFGIPAYIFYVIAASDLSTSMEFLEKYSNKSEYLKDPIMLPGSIALSPEDIPDLVKERNGSGEAHEWALDLCRKYLSADGILVNSFLELESEAFKDLERRRPGIPPVYPVGPLIQQNGSDPHPCLKWLDEQPPKSVVFVSFGSYGTLSMEQFNELALGLELSEQRFLWVVRSPQEKDAASYLNTNYNGTNGTDDPLTFLPKGFSDRTKGKGMVVGSWAPQIDVLAHKSTGGFVTHCGWNSILESSVLGVPLIAWPLCFEQKMNAVFLTDGLKAAVRVKVNANGIVERGQIAVLVKGLIEGEEGERLRKRMIQVKNAAAEVRSPEGSSTKALHEVVQKWITN